MKNYITFTKRFFFPLLLISFLFVQSSVFWTTDTVYTIEDARDVRTGFPISFHSNDFVGVNEISDVRSEFPERMGYGREYYGYTLWHFFFLDIVIVQLTLALALFLIYSAVPSIQKYFKFFSVRSILIGLALAFAVVFGPGIFYSIRYQLIGEGWSSSVMRVPAPPFPTLSVPVPQPIRK